MNIPEKESELLRLLYVAETSLSALLTERPQSKYRYLTELFARIRGATNQYVRNGDKNREFPDARNLYWDDPIDQLEAKSMADAFKVFSFIRS